MRKFFMVIGILMANLVWSDSVSVCGDFIDEIGSDLGVTRKTYLYWVTNNQIHQGLCENGKPVLEENCQNSVKIMPFSRFEDAVSDGIGHDIDQLKVFITSYERQLDRINQQLTQKPDPDLEKQKAIVERELSEYRGKLKMAMAQNEGLFDTLEKLKTTGLIYLVKSDNTLYQNTRPFVRRFESIFEEGGVVSPHGQSMLALGGYHSCYLGSKGVQCWGHNVYGQATVPTLKNPILIAAGGWHTCALDAEGVKCWGSTDDSNGNNHGQSIVPILKNPVAIAAGGVHTCALDAEGVKCWGSNDYGQTSVPTLKKPVAIVAGGAHTCALDAEGIKCWGINNAGQLSVPTLKNPVAIAAGSEHSCALDLEGMKCWGRNDNGQTTVPTLKNPVAIAAGGGRTCALDAEGVKCWGHNLGSMPTLKNPVTIATNGLHSCALDACGVKCWGSNEHGESRVPPDLIP